MKHFILMANLLISCLTFAQNSNLKVYFPQKFFNKKIAENALNKGNSRIRGTAFVNTGGLIMQNKQYAKNKTVVMLFPVTDYFQEWYELKKSKKNAHVMMLPEAFAYHLETTTDEYGNFEFPQMKPGKYYLESTVDYVGVGKGSERIGTVISSWYGYTSTTPVYENYYYNYDAQKKVNQLVEITEDGQLIDVKLRPKVFENISSGSPSSTTCYQLRNKQYGTCKEFFEDGNLKIIADWNESLLDGNFVEYTQNGMKLAEGEFKRGFKVGIWKYYDKDKGYLKSEENNKYKENIGKLEGEVKFYYPSGKLLQIDLYQNGILNGESISYYENSAIKGKVMYQNGALHGKAYHYDTNGKLTKETIFQNGVELK